MSLWGLLRDLIVLDWLFGGRSCHHDDNSVIPPIGGYHNSIDDDFPWHSTYHDSLMDDRDDHYHYGGMGDSDCFGSSSSDFFDDDDY